MTEATQTSKTLNYLDSPIVGPYFCFFIIVWIYMRHYLNLILLYSTFTDFRTVGPFVLNWDTGEYKSPLAQGIAFTLLSSLQAVNLFWLFLILRIGKNYVFNSVKADERSDTEEEDEEEEPVADGSEERAASVRDSLDKVEEALKRSIEQKTQMETDKPALLLNGNPVSGEADQEGIVGRRKKA
jgi:very-long-chain ceramide synthase